MLDLLTVFCATFTSVIVPNGWRLVALPTYQNSRNLIKNTKLMQNEELSNEEKGNDTTPHVIGSAFKGDCDKNIHWYIGVYSQGQWIYNKCAYCGKRQNL